jgi:integrase
MPKLTDAIVAALPVTGRQYLKCEPGSGYAVHVTCAGTKVLVARVRFRGQRIRVPLGRFPDLKVAAGRDLARTAIADIRAGKNPILERELRVKAARAGDITVARLAEKWLAEYVRPKLKPRTADDYGKLLDQYILPAVGRLPVSRVSRDDATRMHVAMVKTPRRANYALRTLGGLMQFACDLKLRPPLDNPARRIKLYREGKRERFLSEEEFASAAEAITEAEREGVIGPYAAAGLRLCMLTGARSGEITATKWKHIDFDRRIIRLPDSKTNEPRTIHLSEAAIEVLKTLPRRGPYVIAGAKDGEPFKNLSRSWIVARAKRGLDDVRLHDLRHSFASLGLKNGVPLAMIGALLGHKVAATTQRYAHLARGAVANVNDQIGAAMAAAIEPKDQPAAKIVKLRRRRGQRHG